MMFDKNLFFSLCEKYNVEISPTATSPMIKDDFGVHAITKDDVNRVFSPCQAYFEYSNFKVNTNTDSVFYMQEDCTIAC